MDFESLNNLLKNLNAETGNFSVGKKDDSKVVSIFERDNVFVVRLWDDRGISEVTYSEEKDAIKSFILNLATAL